MHLVDLLRKRLGAALRLVLNRKRAATQSETSRARKYAAIGRDKTPLDDEVERGSASLFVFRKSEVGMWVGAETVKGLGRRGEPERVVVSCLVQVI